MNKVPNWSIENAKMKTSYEHKENNLNQKSKDQYNERLKNCTRQIRNLLKELKKKRIEYKDAKKNRIMLLKETWRQNRITMKMKIKEVKSNIAIVRLEFRKLIKEMKIQNNAALI